MKPQDFDEELKEKVVIPPDFYLECQSWGTPPLLEGFPQVSSQTGRGEADF